MCAVWSSDFVCPMLFSCMNVQIVFIRSSVERVSSLLFGAMTSNAAMNSVVWCPQAHIYLEDTLGVELLGHRACTSSLILR